MRVLRWFSKVKTLKYTAAPPFVTTSGPWVGTGIPVSGWRGPRRGGSRIFPALSFKRRSVMGAKFYSYLFLLFFGCGVVFAQNYDAMSISELTEEMKKYPSGSAEYYNVRGTLYSRTQSYQEAVNDFSAAIELKPENKTYYASRGMAYFAMSDDEKAISDFTIYIDEYNKTSKPVNVHLIKAYLSRAGLYYRQKKFIEAYEDTNIVLGISPDHIGAYILRPQIYLNYFNSPDDALEDIDKYLSLVPEGGAFTNITAQMYATRSDAYLMKGEIDKSIENLTKGISLYPSAFLYYKRGLIYELQQRYADAANDFSIAIEENPEKKELIYESRGSVYFLMSEQETDPSRKAEYRRKAEEDGAMYTGLTGKTIEWNK
jgi:tetratricopeptide (TPR) repeat protein